jgi:peptidoglycan/xylan/chitin deacetylase (PgdA/CDA1 family)
MYHQVGRFQNPRTHRAVYCDIGRFRRQMSALGHLGFTVISLGDAYAGLFQGKPLPPRPVVLTFDDGCDNFREHAWPVLKARDFPATLFVIADKLGQTADWMDTEDAKKTPLLTAAAIRDLRRDGCGIGSHTLNHVRLAQCPLETARREILGSKARLEDLLGEPVPDFCYPYGSYNADVARLVSESGYRLALTCVRAAANRAPDPFRLPRKAVSYGDTLPGFLWKVLAKNTPKPNAFPT